MLDTLKHIQKEPERTGYQMPKDWIDQKTKLQKDWLIFSPVCEVRQWETAIMLVEVR